MVKLFFRKPFVYLKPTHYGGMVNSLVILVRRPNYARRLPVSGEGQVDDLFSGKEQIQYRYEMVVDLWLIQLHTSWRGRKWHDQ